LFHQSGNYLPFALALVFIAGLIATATPCVYPIIPITSAILMARGAGSRRLGQMHAGVYFVGLIFFYTLLGAFAASTGTALSAIMTNPWVNLGFAVLFVYLGLSMLGLYEFQLLTTLTAKLDTASSRRSGFSGTFFMGLTAGLVVSPCVGPVVGAILLSITGNAAAVGATGGSIPTSILVRGIAMMTAFGAGLGLPFLVIGLLSNRLPQSGGWLTQVKFLLGLPILYFAYTYYVKSLETLGVAPNVSHAILVGIVAIALAVFVGAFHPLGESPQRHLLLRRACGIILLIIGVHFLYNGLARSGILIELPASASINVSSATRSADPLLPANGTQAEMHGNLRWLRDASLARQQARAEQKPLFVDFYADWCANCKAFGRLALRDTTLNTALQDAVLVKVYDTDEDFKTFQQDSRFPELRGVGGQPFLPLFAIYSPQGEFVWKGQDYQAVGTMVAQLERARQTSIR
jgi:thiol:disulfide interchange protein DsbD